MAVTLRFKRMGRRNCTCFRLAALDKRTARNGKVIEELGFYLPAMKDPAKQVSLNKERIEYWLSMGATPSDTVSQLLKKQGIKCPAAAKA